MATLLRLDSLAHIEAMRQSKPLIYQEVFSTHPVATWYAFLKRDPVTCGLWTGFAWGYRGSFIGLPQSCCTAYQHVQIDVRILNLKLCRKSTLIPDQFDLDSLIQLSMVCACPAE